VGSRGAASPEDNHFAGSTVHTTPTHLEPITRFCASCIFSFATSASTSPTVASCAPMCGRCSEVGASHLMIRAKGRAQEGDAHRSARVGGRGW
jgi:hypothetical protein